MSELPQPVTTDHLYMAAILIQLQKISNALEDVARVLATVQKPSIQVQLDTARLVDAIEAAQNKRSKSQMKK